jgi:hypothetical protein
MELFEYYRRLLLFPLLHSRHRLMLNALSGLETAHIKDCTASGCSLLSNSILDSQRGNSASYRLTLHFTNKVVQRERMEVLIIEILTSR